MSEEFKGSMTSLFEEFRKAIAVETVVGKPIELEDKILIPICSVGFGAGGGGGARKEKESQGYGIGGGGGVSPVALVVVFKGIPGPDGLKVLSLKPSGTLEKLVGEALPMVLGKVKELKEGRKAEEKP